MAVALSETAKLGKVTQVIGPVVDVEFPAGSLPEIFTALTVSNPGISDKSDNLTIEVAQHLGENTARCIAMDSTDGLVRGQQVKNTGGPISVPVGKEVLGRILNRWTRRARSAPPAGSPSTATRRSSRSRTCG